MFYLFFPIHPFLLIDWHLDLRQCIIIFNIIVIFYIFSLFVSQEDSQRYYSWRSFGPVDKRTQDLWVDLNSMHQGPVRVHAILSNTHRQASVRQPCRDIPVFLGKYVYGSHGPKKNILFLLVIVLLIILPPWLYFYFSLYFVYFPLSCPLSPH